jgi:hypothetical protein
VKTLDQFDFGFQLSIDRKQVRVLAGLSFVERAMRPPPTGPVLRSIRIRMAGSGRASISRLRSRIARWMPSAAWAARRTLSS